MAEVRVENVRKVFGKVVAVSDVSLQFPDGKFVILLGPSGCGKTTLLRLLAGLEEATSGKIFIGGREVTRLPARDREVAMVFQNYALYPHMSVLRNLRFALEIKKVPEDEIKRRVDAATEILGIGELLDRRPRQLSGGQQQRVALGRAIVRDPAVFLFDEPLSNLDAKLRAAMRGELIKLQRRLNVTSIYVTHDQVEAMTMGDVVVIMRDGIVQQQGAPLAIYQDPDNLFVAQFLGSPAMNVFEGDLETDSGMVRAVEGGLTVNLGRQLCEHVAGAGAKHFVFGIRPEHLAIDTAPAADDSGTSVEGTVELVEALGADSIIEVDVFGTALAAKIHADRTPEVGARVRLSLDPKRVYIFDRDSGERLRGR